MSRTIIETVPVEMTYDEYRVFEAIAQSVAQSVPDTILRLASLAARQWAEELEG